MTSLQLGLIAAGALLVGAVLLYNWVQERKIRRRIDEAFGVPAARRDDASDGGQSPTSGRIEPTLQEGRSVNAIPENGPRARTGADAPDDGYEPPLEIQDRIKSDMAADDFARAPQPLGEAARLSSAERNAPQPDPDIECIVALQPARPVTAGALAAGLHARLGRPIRWFGRRGDGLPWQWLKSDTVGEFSEVVACLLLANRAGTASRPLLEGFMRVVGEIAAGLPAAIVAPDAAAEAARAEALDRICADLDVQIGLTLLKSEAALIPGTRLRGIAEAAGFRLVDGGRFDWVQEETGAVLYSLQNYRSEPFTADTLRATSTPGAVFLLDVPRVIEPVRAYDQMKLAAKRMAQSLDATLVDDNRRVLDDPALQAIREQVRNTAEAMREVNIEPGSPRALALFGG
ncbi:MAG: cell division protein ZipA C-terminal FtsZ-binding domain-containing protein [Betaproteobacteria bacterium]